MGLGKTIRKWIGAADAKSLSPLASQLSEARKRLKDSESLLKATERRITSLEEKLAVIEKHLEFADASGTVEAFGWVADASPEESVSHIAGTVAHYLKARRLPARAVFLGEGGEDFAAALREAGADLVISSASDGGPISVCHLGDLSAEAFAGAIRHWVTGHRLADGALLRVPSARHAGLLNPILASSAGAPIQWMPWRLSRSGGTWLIVWRDGEAS